ncbi:secreted protein [Rhodopirellula maiorica SM1]|uniref:Secreted protein n=1 Tax=Rhodopirellula maiorica SM1 TaxID=1265738 RepID=M5RMB2_9BACT|nr:hypothetical protein [Rhodopirellula maiorica]EMI20316.1 secreted protein [Rhodopirellula maiorica SM1]
MIRKLCLMVSLFMFSCITGCGDSAPTNVIEDADEQAIADYQAELEREQALLEADEGE